jgi:crotonobetainyl-CoA:carnitine CoA-transferase CaiB-like acyl-CoA transferase
MPRLPYPGPLAGTKVVEWGDHISAPYAARLLGDLGAEVIKVEPPGGDSARRHGPFPGEPHPEQSGLYHVLNFNKRSVVLDVEAADDRERLDSLVGTATIFITNVPLAERAEIGFDLEQLVERHPRLVAVAVTPYGDHGPYADVPGSSLTAGALSASNWVIGQPDRPPLSLPFDLADYEGGANAAAAALTGLLGVLRGGPGQVIDISIAEILLAFVGVNARMYVPYEKPWARAGRSASGSGGSYPYMIVPCRDGYIAMIGRGQRDWDNIVAAMGTPEWALQERFGDPIVIARDDAAEANVLLGAWFATKTRDELLALARKHQFALSPVRSIAEILREPQFHHRGLFLDPIDVGDKSVTPAGPSYALSGWAAPKTVTPAPRLGEHTQAVLGELAARPEEMVVGE